MLVALDPRSALPPYEQVRQQIVALVIAGVLEPGTRLPSIRQLASDLGVAGGTVARAYRELEDDGVVTARGRHGTAVSGTPADGVPAPKVLTAAERFVDRAATAGADVEDAVVAVRAAFAARGTR